MEKIWLSTYPQDVPREINPDLYSSLAAMFEDSCKKYANKPALCNLNCVVTYGELGVKSKYFAAFVQNQLGLKKGERIAIMLPNIMQYYVTFFGAMLAGLVVVNVNPLYTAPELIKQLNDSESETIVVLANFAHELQHALPETKIKNVIVTEVADLCGLLKRTVVNFIVRNDLKKVPPWQISNAINFCNVMSIGKKLKFNPVTIVNSDLALLQYTGGTTGVSKAAMLSHRNLLANVEQCLAVIGNRLTPGAETCFTVLPLYHIFSLTICCLTFTRFGAFQILITNPRDIPAMVKTLQQFSCSVFIGLTTLFNALVNNSQFRALDFSKAKLTVAGGMAMNAEVASKWYAITKNVVIEGYGLTEASPVVSISPFSNATFISSIGAPVPSTEISIRDENNHEVKIGEEGELWVRGPQVMQGYWNNAGETQKVLTADGWLKTGDIVVIDENGYLYLVDRKKDMIVVAGFNVYPSEVEAVIASHPMVHEVAVVGALSEHAGEVVKAFIVRNDESLTKDKIIAFCKDRLTSYKVPKRIEFVSALPKSNIGKILRRALRHQ